MIVVHLLCSCSRESVRFLLQQRGGGGGGGGGGRGGKFSNFGWGLFIFKVPQTFLLNLFHFYTNNLG